ncbi:hypothetical protein L218DRAFT_976431 [Marasmius fiardii PR-910]|nr:hypothetical protein L218DRAFT_976431 [Marasmius fiardii PR-910]
MATTGEKLDLAKIPDLREYLKDTPFAAEEINVLSGGNANFAFRIKLKTPYDGISTMVVKHAKPICFATEVQRFEFGVVRQRYEVEALKHIQALNPPDSLVIVPRVNHFDEKENVIIMDDCGADSVTLKKFVIDGRCNPQMAEKIGSALGVFLGGLHHTWGRKNVERLIEALTGHSRQAKEISAWAVYGRLGATIRGEDPMSNVSENPPEVREDDVKRMEEIGEKISSEIMNAEEDFVMGDFWTGNILLDLVDDGSDIKHIFVIDWEIAKPGLQGLDVGQFCAEVDLIRRYYPSKADVSSKIIASFYTSYSNLDAKKDVGLYQRALAHWGAHLVVWTPRVEWGGPEETRVVVKDGVELLLEGYDPTELYLPQSFPYPIKVTSIDANVSDNVERGSRLLSYSFTYLSRVSGAKPETRFGTWDCAIEGSLQKWNVGPGDTISQRHAKENPVVVIVEPCKHGIQLGGLCVLCGKDMTNSDYIGFSDASRASIQMTHSAFGPTVSLEEAQRIERETAERLLKSRKLSLIVDLDQTIVHATVDPTVGEWILEGEAWEAKRAEIEGSEKPSDDEDCNPNWEALKDVKKFRLGPESLGVSSSQKGKSAGKTLDQGCMYYIKPRPGWDEFLKMNATKYEMHVYTMGTRAYAEQVCAAIDPDGSIFGGRLLSRDESGSLTQKSLQRLFPCDTSMVVIIDDRADVWEWSPNLIKVIPYEFFIGIGDINSAFLPKLEPLTAATPATNTREFQKFIYGDGPLMCSPSASPKAPEQSDVLAPDPLTSPETEDNQKNSKEFMMTENSLALEAQVEERPLAKRQEELQEAPAAEHKAPSQTPTPTSDVETPPSNETNENTDEGKSEVAFAPVPRPERTPRKALLKNDDRELDRVNNLLDDIHRRFFSEYDNRSSTKDPKTKKTKTSKKEVAYDVTRIIPSIRFEVLKGVHLLFSSVIPLDTRPESTEIWRMAHMFGAKCSTELTPEITHVVAAKRGTVKVEAARKRGNVRVVWLAWFTDSIALWRHQDEIPYLLDDPPGMAGPSSSPTTSLNQISSDPDIDEDEDWELEAGSVGAGSGPGGGGVGGSASIGGGGSFSVDQINWDDINDEVEAAMLESDDDEEDMIDIKSERSGGIRSGNVSEDEWSDESNSVISANNSPRPKRKRLRSLTPSEAGLNGESDVLRSPLSKRKKLAADRSGFSRLKEAISAEDLQSESRTQSDESNSDRGSGRATPNGRSPRTKVSDDMDDEEEEDDDEEIEDDFLARELEEDWG